MTSKESAPGTSNGTSKGPLAQDQHDEGSEEELNFSDEEGGYRIEDIYIPPPPRPALTTEDIGPRLIIIRITNRWFKSYAGPCIVGPFHKRFSAVIGPNGSGKSNVIDSMLFVFGYRASRIRSKKVSALIHKSEKYQDVESCSVAVHFAQITDKEGDAYDILPGSEFVVSRTANGDNSSYYELNGRRVQFREVALVLRKHGIDLDNNRFLILQGEVEQISLMKHKAENEHEIGMLEYLEDIIGTGRYKEPLAKLTERRQELSDKRNDKLNRCKLVKTELDKLKEPMEEAVAYLQLENNIAAAKNILIQIEIHATEADLASKNYQKEGLELELNQTVDNLKDLQSAQHKTKKNYSNASKEYAALEATKNKCKQVFEKLNGRDLELQAGMVETNKNRKKLKKQLETEQKKKAELSTIPEKAEEYIKELQTKEEELVNKKQKLEDDKQEVLVSIKDCTKELQERKEVLQADLAQLLSKVNEAKSAYTIAETELNIYTSNAESEQKKLDDLKAAHETARQMVIQRKGEIDGLKQEIPDAESKLQAATREFDKLTTRQYELTAQRREKTASMESSKSSMESMRSKGKVLDSLTQQKREGNCPGLFGRLGDLGAIDQKYDVAVSTACGALDHIVVDTVDTAEWCIEFLKKYDIGRATFIALDKQEHLRSAADSTIQTPEDVPRLYDLIRVQDDRVKTAFYFGLRDTLVASNLDQGSRIAYGRRRFRVVTLAGNLIETSGTMSGGGKRVSRGRMGQSIAAAEVQPEEIERLETQLRDMEREFVGNRERLTALNEAINELKQKLKEMKFNLNKFTLELDSLKIQEPALLGQMNEQRNKINDIKLDPEVVKDKTKTVAKFKEAHEKAQSNTARFQVEVDAITKEITDKTSGRVRAVDKRIKEVAKNLNAVQAQLTKEKISIANVPRNLAKCEEKIATLEEDILNSENKLTDMKTQRDEIEVDGAQVNKHLEGLAQQIEEKEEGLEKLKKEAAALDKQENEIKGSKIEIDGKLEVINKQVNQLQATVLGYRSELAKVKYHEVPDHPLEELKTYTAEELAEKNVEALKHEITTCRKALQRQQPNFAAIEEYKKRHGEYLDRVGQVEAVTEQWNKIGSVFNSLRNRRKTEFLTAFRIIRLKLREMYQMITLGGDADLELIDSYDPFTEGIKLNVRPPKKPWKDITNLSGGEKTLSSLALVFALHYYKPSPLYVMDEIDAALDFKNVSIIAHYIKERTKNAQFIIISLRPNMFELANYLVGIYKVQNCTSAITLDVGAFAKRGQASSGNANMEENNPPMEEERSQEQSQQDGAEDLEETLEEMSPSTVHSGTDTVIADSFPGSEDVEEMDVSK